MRGLAFDCRLEMEFLTDRKRLPKDAPDPRLPELEVGLGEALIKAGDLRSVVVQAVALTSARLVTGRSR